jgi:thiamine biosynthesis lipoprotein
VRLDRASCVATLEPGTELDLGGVAKGYIIDQALAVLRRRGLSTAMIEAGGDIVVGDPPPGARGWRISVPHDDPALSARAAALVNAAISTSGDAEQFVEIGGRRYSHIVDPRTGLGSTTRALATVIAPRGAIADALATALAVVGAEGAAALLERSPESMGVVRSVNPVP